MKEEKIIFKELAKKIYINPSDEVISTLEEEYNLLQKNIEIMQEINVDNLEPLSYLGNTISSSNLRDDEPNIFNLPTKEEFKETILKNAPSKKDGYITIKRIIK